MRRRHSSPTEIDPRQAFLHRLPHLPFPPPDFSPDPPSVSIGIVHSSGGYQSPSSSRTPPPPTSPPPFCILSSCRRFCAKTIPSHQAEVVFPGVRAFSDRNLPHGPCPFTSQICISDRLSVAKRLLNDHDRWLSSFPLSASPPRAISRVDPSKLLASFTESGDLAKDNWPTGGRSRSSPPAALLISRTFASHPSNGKLGHLICMRVADFSFKPWRS